MSFYSYELGTEVIRNEKMQSCIILVMICRIVCTASPFIIKYTLTQVLGKKSVSPAISLDVVLGSYNRNRFK